MSVYIKSMDMPKSCEDCFCYRHNAEYDYAYCNISSVKVLGNANARLNNCPLIPVPDHGRLIDADALPTYDKPIGKMMMFGGEYVYTQTAIDNAPTIIPPDLPVMYYPQVEGITPTIIQAEEHSPVYESLKRGLEQAINGETREEETE